jgi:hypothetical protein
MIFLPAPQPLPPTDVPIHRQLSISSSRGAASTGMAGCSMRVAAIAPAFEADLRRSLAEFAAHGPLEKVVDYTVIIARR